ncbi:PREDICTED: protein MICRORCHIDIA 1-like [Nicotiana attenuata]|uniref:Protein microrchidia 1 n=1 Tax=Nicotiana attenuata TaxID=49451 RepID=A0A1J6IQ21_NICAT|nr:PREDICTED: protein MICRORCHIDIA 1-like [Nicotiana attenuata]OIT06356.1 protein microrchidia 1 [Nicotiana attenuata]
MSPEKPPIDVVELDSSDDEGAGVIGKRKPDMPPGGNSLSKSPVIENPNAIVPSNYRPLESRSFWKAGNFEVGRIKSTAIHGELEHARVHPKFLHSNATSHKWAFGAIAELLDNAVDEISSGATFVKVDRIYNPRDNSPALLFQDDGGGMDPERLRKCMSLGYSSKTSNSTIGQYGNGFKTSTMRLGADVIVFSRSSQSGRATQSIGLLSYTFLRRTGQDDVIVPMIDFDISDHWAEPILCGSQDDWSTNLKTILEWSPFATKMDLMQQFEDIKSHGTKIIVYNLWLNDEGIYELNFDDDDEDIMLRDEANCGNTSKTNKRALEQQSHISYRLRYSLRAYTSILYLKKFTNFSIVLRGKPVEQFNILEELKHSKVITYRPQLAVTSKEILVETTLGFVKDAPSPVCGFNIYHKNRLIRPFWKVTADGSSKGNGVVGVLEANFIEPAHDKQDFERSSLFFKLETRLKQMVMDYWKGHCHLIGLKPLEPHLQNLQREQAANAQIQSPTINYQPVTGLAAHPRPDFRSVQSDKVGRTNSSRELPAVQPITGNATGSVQKDTQLASSSCMSIDQICEENIQLFRRCESYIQRETELKRTIEELEKELEDTKKKSADLSSRLESQKKLKLLKQFG